MHTATKNSWSHRFFCGAIMVAPIPTSCIFDSYSIIIIAHNQVFHYCKFFKKMLDMYMYYFFCRKDLKHPYSFPIEWHPVDSETLSQTQSNTSVDFLFGDTHQPTKDISESHPLWCNIGGTYINSCILLNGLFYNHSGYNIIIWLQCH